MPAAKLITYTLRELVRNHTAQYLFLYQPVLSYWLASELCL